MPSQCTERITQALRPSVLQDVLRSMGFIAVETTGRGNRKKPVVLSMLDGNLVDFEHLPDLVASAAMLWMLLADRGQQALTEEASEHQDAIGCLDRLQAAGWLCF